MACVLKELRNIVTVEYKMIFEEIKRDEPEQVRFKREVVRTGRALIELVIKLAVRGGVVYE